MNLYLPIHWGNSENNTAFRDISYICCYSGNSSAAVAPPPPLSSSSDVLLLCFIVVHDPQVLPPLAGGSGSTGPRPCPLPVVGPKLLAV